MGTRGRTGTVLAAVLVVAGLAVFTASAPLGAAPNVTIAEFTQGISANTSGVAAGPDGNVWFTEYEGSSIGSITPAGVVTEYPLLPSEHPSGIVAGPDGNLWFTVQTTVVDNSCSIVSGQDWVGRITPDGVITRFDTVNPNAGPDGITVGPDGQLWYAQRGYLCVMGTVVGGGGVGRSTTDGAQSQFTAGFDTQAGLSSITSGPDGNLWFTFLYDQVVGRMTPSGTVATFPLTSTEFAGGITTGPDGQLWFTVPRTNVAVASMTTDGDITYHRDGLSPDASPTFLTTGPDGALWYTDAVTNEIGRVTTAGAFTIYSQGITPDSNPWGIATGPDGDLWFSSINANLMSRLTIAEPPTTTTTSAPTTSTTSTTPATPTSPAAVAVPGTPTYTG